MFKAEKFTKTNLNDLRTDLDEVLKKYADISGIKITVGNIRYSKIQATVKLEVSLPNSEGTYLTREEEAFDMYAKMDNISLTRGEIGNMRGLGKIRFVGYKSKNRTYPYIVESVDNNKRYKITTRQAQTVLKV